MLLTVWFFAVRPRGGRWALLGFRRVKPISTTIIVVFGVAVAQSAVIGYTLLVQQLGIDFLIPSDLPREWAADAPVSFAIIAISAVIVAPLVEEIFFRGFMYQALRRTMAILPAALLTSVVFGIAHIDPAIIIPIARCGYDSVGHIPMDRQSLEQHHHTRGLQRSGSSGIGNTDVGRIAAAFQRAREQGRAAIAPYFTVGYPDVDATH